MQVKWTKNAAEDLKFWQKNDLKTVKRIKDLLEDIKSNPFKGLGKPEPLRYNLTGCWSRRISGDHRLVYKVEKKDIIILQCRYHYR